MVVTKKKRGRERGVFDIDGIEMPFAPIFFYAPDGLPDFTAATKANKRYGYLSDAQGLVGSPKEIGYDSW